jgi:hypothetical protein
MKEFNRQISIDLFELIMELEKDLDKETIAYIVRLLFSIEEYKK